MEGLEWKIWGQMSVALAKTGSLEYSVTDKAYIRNGRGTSSGAQTYNTYQ